ncbi:MAG: hypothetical protein AAF927_08960 [Bacteroidota bacterium]
MRLAIIYGLLAILILPSQKLSAHGPVHELINEVSRKIKADPQNAQLYLERGEYFRLDHNFDASYADLLFAERLDSSLQLDVAFQLAKLFSEHSYPQSGLMYIDKFLAARPQHVKALITRAGIFKQLGQDSLSVRDFSDALHYAQEPRPHHFLEIAQATLRTDSTDFAGAKYWLEKGESVLGFNIVLRSYAIEIDRLAEEWPAALAKVEDIIARLPRHEKWLLYKAELLEEAGQIPEAIKTYEATLNAIDQLPRRMQATRAVSEWQATAILRLQALQNG